ncbi:MAG: integral rane sensor signal transduction histidine kinase, partial [Clostridia bacterium]|nr:integral rane sensor signal transduction histidine kinase [Clostridia bacterium]
MYNTVYKKINFLKKLTEEQKIMFIYRYASLLITSIFYFFAPVNHTIDKKLFIIGCIGLSSIILNYIYIRYNNDISTIKLLVFIETIGNSIMLIPSGGLNSPYVWYALNTIFIAAIMLERKYCILNLFAYLISSTWITYYVFNDEQQNFTDLLEHQSNLIISFILITIAIWLLLRYVKEIMQERIKLLKANKELITANHQVKESVNHIMELYQAVHLFSNIKNKDEIIELILAYTKRIVTTDMIVFFKSDKKESITDTISSDVCNRITDQLQILVSEVWKDLENRNTAVQLNVEDKCFLVISVKSSYMTYGVLGVEIKPRKESFNQVESMDQIKFLADLSSIVLEKFELEIVNDKLIITEEQNRIANEIHDSVLQRLFSTSIGIYGIMKKLNKVNIKTADADLGLIRESVDHAMKELRAAIYGLSWKKDGTDNFVIDITNYINEIKKMNNIDI